jgi:predicted nucleic acid-binding protein
VKIYLDLCTIKRPLDTPNQVRILLEAEAVLGIIAFCETGQAELLSSEALVFEGEQSSYPLRREHTIAILSKAKDFVDISEKDKDRAKNLTVFGIKPLDALHLALAESGNADYFCTCDDRLFRSSRQMIGLKVKVVNPIELVQEMEK